MEFSTETFAKECVDAINQRVNGLHTLNIIVVGKTGVGKSTLINSIFGEELATTGMGKPITTYMTKVQKDGFPIHIYDTRGFELGKEAQIEVRNEVIDTIKDGIKSKDVNQQIHCIWYCVNTATNRIEPEEIEWLREFSKENQITNVPVILVLTQSFSKKNAAAMKDYIANEKLDVIDIVPVLAKEYDIDDELTIPSYGLDQLIQVMADTLPEELKETLINAQRASLNLKRYYARQAVALATSATFGEGFIPIPFADSAVMIPTEISMIASITAVYGLRVDKSIMVGFISSILGTGTATIAGRTIVSYLAKLIPGAGTLVGGMLSGSTAAILTKSLGEAYIALMELLWLGELNTADLQTKEGRTKLRAQITERLKDRSTEEKANLPDNYTLSDIILLPEGLEIPETLQNLPKAMHDMSDKVTQAVSSNVKSGVKAMRESSNFDEWKERVLPKDSKLGKAIQVYKILSEEENKDTNSDTNK